MHADTPMHETCNQNPGSLWADDYLFALFLGCSNPFGPKKLPSIELDTMLGATQYSGDVAEIDMELA